MKKAVTEGGGSEAQSSGGEVILGKKTINLLLVWGLAVVWVL